MKRPLGLTIIAGLVTLLGGTITLSLGFEVINAVRFSGLYGVSIGNPDALTGFLLYGLLPVLFYALGIGLYLGRYWAYGFVFKIFPFLFFLFLVSSFASVVRMRMYGSVGFFRLLFLRPQIIFWALFLSLCIVWPILNYLKLPYVERYFQDAKNFG